MSVTNTRMICKKHNQDRQICECAFPKVEEPAPIEGRCSVCKDDWAVATPYGLFCKKCYKKHKVKVEVGAIKNVEMNAPVKSLHNIMLLETKYSKREFVIRLLAYIQSEVYEMDGLLVKHEPRLQKLKTELDEVLNWLGEI